ncbi:hypothetical protein FUA23_11650 [Neolewinella aurantiaca]|uniref:Uncharacterized protein n=1 Tax=Neolewinella aurantiaca TaxID=2602767 RepID=A0A5C7FSH8_9BACT|nr:hypothetical protein [Neolewinella aurantiaca]TXF89158.1 hypothetical protein FUA23_11650 [Neolewinella aurantiaca]
MRCSYSEVKFVYLDTIELSQMKGEPPARLNDKIAEDLGHWGDDNYFFLLDFVERFQLGHSGYVHDDHFESEGEIITIRDQLLAPLAILVWLSWKIIERAFPGCPTPGLLCLEYDRSNPRKDLTVGDLIAWRLSGDFCLRKDADIRTY